MASWTEVDMRTIIAGSRTITSMLPVYQAVLESGFTITRVLCGMCDGVDRNGREWAHKYNIPVHEYPADWNTHGRAAGPIRNSEMVRNADALIAVRANGKSDGTDDCIAKARAAGLKVYVKHV